MRYATPVEPNEVMTGEVVLEERGGEKFLCKCLGNGEFEPLRGYFSEASAGEPAFYSFTHRFISDGTWFDRGTDCYPVATDFDDSATFVGMKDGRWDGEFCQETEFVVVRKRRMGHLGGSRGILTHHGTYFDPTNPEASLVSVEDIAFALSRVSRFTGHTPIPISVAQHSVNVYRRTEGLPLRVRLQALFHDASEAYLGDVPSPVKKHLPDYQALESRVMEAVAERLGFDWPEDSAVKEADAAEFEREWEYINAGIVPYGPVLTPEEARREFMKCYEEISRIEVPVELPSFMNERQSEHLSSSMDSLIDRYNGRNVGRLGKLGWDYDVSLSEAVLCVHSLYKKEGRLFANIEFVSTPRGIAARDLLRAGTVAPTALLLVSGDEVHEILCINLV